MSAEVPFTNRRCLDRSPSVRTRNLSLSFELDGASVVAHSLWISERARFGCEGGREISSSDSAHRQMAT